MVGDMGDLKLRVWLSAEAEGPDLLVVRCLQQRFRTFVVLFDLTPGDADLHGARSDHEETKREWSRGPFYFFVTPSCVGGSLTPASRVSLRGLVCLQRLEATVMEGVGTCQC